VAFQSHVGFKLEFGMQILFSGHSALKEKRNCRCNLLQSGLSRVAVLTTRFGRPATWRARRFRSMSCVGAHLSYASAISTFLYSSLTRAKTLAQIGFLLIGLGYRNLEG